MSVVSKLSFFVAPAPLRAHSPSVRLSIRPSVPHFLCFSFAFSGLVASDVYSRNTEWSPHAATWCETQHQLPKRRYTLAAQRHVCWHITGPPTPRDERKRHLISSSITRFLFSPSVCSSFYILFAPLPIFPLLPIFALPTMFDLPTMTSSSSYICSSSGLLLL